MIYIDEKFVSDSMLFKNIISIGLKLATIIDINIPSDYIEMLKSALCTGIFMLIRVSSDVLDIWMSVKTFQTICTN